MMQRLSETVRDCQRLLLYRSLQFFGGTSRRALSTVPVIKLAALCLFDRHPPELRNTSRLTWVVTEIQVFPCRWHRGRASLHLLGGDGLEDSS